MYNTQSYKKVSVIFIKKLQKRGSNNYFGFGNCLFFPIFVLHIKYVRKHE